MSNIHEWIDPDVDFIRADFDDLRRGRLMVFSQAVVALSTSIDVLDTLGHADDIGYQINALKVVSRALADGLMVEDTR